MVPLEVVVPEGALITACSPQTIPVLRWRVKSVATPEKVARIRTARTFRYDSFTRSISAIAWWSPLKAHLGDRCVDRLGELADIVGSTAAAVAVRQMAAKRRSIALGQSANAAGCAALKMRDTRAHCGHDLGCRFRRGLPFIETTSDGQLRVGLNFCSFQASLVQFDVVFTTV
jgi:hypothetical protein